MKCHNCNSPDCYRGGKVCAPGGEELLRSLTPAEEQMLKVASDVEREFYCKLTRVEELIEFSRRMGFKKIGVAFCIGLFEETRVLVEYLEKAGFSVFSAACKVGAVDKSLLKIEKMRPDSLEATCNPVLQAQALNRAGTELNVIVGLCIGHDIIFQNHSKAPTTTLIVKDRVLAHNPAGAIYSNYYKRRLGG
ncbi:protein of unknown function DUF1847 [Thermovibrio ammonificans HB-1]|uniref:Metal-binding protein n=1 Tax=Thermovibrio ammonificans (strain DSM 15698 / JCM 12110 / HB-1) TaxID=648996 RepID=E8T3P5_THEA1|nr:DUF1847 domain-containing protein [Thermovibrio ammonificans]ADU97302.1 protein of unknown function DUF1847 [Thermovibrio ammonificans HB-1]